MAAPPESVARSVAGVISITMPTPTRPTSVPTAPVAESCFVAEQPAREQRREDRHEREEDRADAAGDRPLPEEQQPVCEPDSEDARRENARDVAAGPRHEVGPVVRVQHVAAEDEGCEIEPDRDEQQRRHVGEAGFRRDERPAEQHAHREKRRRPAVVAQTHRASSPTETRADIMRKTVSVISKRRGWAGISRSRNRCTAGQLVGA